MARRRRRRRGGAAWWIFGAGAAIAAWLGFRWTHGSLGGPAAPSVVGGGESALDGAAPAALPSGDAALPASVADRPGAPSPTASPGPGIAARAAGAPAKPPAREELSEDDRKALDAVLERATRRPSSR